MFIFLTLNEDSVRDSYLKFERRRGDSPSSKWYILYVITHILKAPFLAPMIFILLILNGGKLVK